MKIEQAKQFLIKKIDFFNIVEKNGYDYIIDYGNSFKVRKEIKSDNTGAYEAFFIHWSSQESGYLSLGISFNKKLAESTDSIEIKYFLTNHIEKLEDKIKEYEAKCITVSNSFNK